jgi:Secretion system C-terminal sorting domain
MKKINIFILLIFIIITANISIKAQLLNGSFEHWDILGNPVNWYTSNLPGITKTINQSSDAHDGISSVRIDVVEEFGEASPGSLQSFDDVNQFGHPITENYTNLTGYYKFLPQGSAQLILAVSIYSQSFSLVGVGGLNIYNASENWSQFDVPIILSLLDSNAASVVVSISITDNFEIGFDPATIGSIALIDNLSFGNPTNVKSNERIGNNFSLSQNYPNPFNPITTIKYSIVNVETGYIPSVQLKVYDILGNEIATLVNKEQSQGNYEIEFDGLELTSGIYFYKLQAGDFIRTKKMILLK